MAKKHIPPGASPGLGLMQRAANALASTQHSVFNPSQYVVRNAMGHDMAGPWAGEAIERITVHEPSTVTRSWRVHFWPNKFLALLPVELTKEEAVQVGENLMELTNMRRTGP